MYIAQKLAETVNAAAQNKSNRNIFLEPSPLRQSQSSPSLLFIKTIASLIRLVDKKFLAK